MESLSPTKTPPGILALCRFVDIDGSGLLDCTLSVVGVELNDPGNAGTIIRSAVAAGAEGVCLGRGSVDIYNPKVVRASAGALFGLRLARDVDVSDHLESLSQAGIKCVAADPLGDRHYWEVDMRGPVAILIGNEAQGMSPDLLASVEERAVIPMAEGAESLNAGVAASILLFEARRQRER